MTTARIRYYPTIVGAAIAWHFICAATLYVDSSSINATPLYSMMVAISNVTGSEDILIAVAVFSTVAILALVGMFVGDSYWRLGLMIWQHIVLWVSATGSLFAMYDGRFADGVYRSRGFLIVDQSPLVLLALAHAVALCVIALEGRPGNARRRE